MTTQEDKRAELRQDALNYHEFPTPGKIAVTPTKQLINQRDLALAYSPGVASACEEIVADPANAFRYTARGNLVAVVSNGTAVLGLGNIGPLASKPVMEGKGVLFKKFAGIDVFDLEIAQNDLDKLVDCIAALEPTFGGINLEDIKAPDCFYVERELRKRMKIPVFHDDQHGTAIVVGSALLNGLKVCGKRIEDVKLVVSGAGAAALACLNLLLKLGMPRKNIWVTDLAGVVYTGRVELMDPDKAEFAQETDKRTLAEVMHGADVFLGLSAGGVLKPAMVATMNANPIIFALANPTPEIAPEDVQAVRNDAIMATGRSDYPNQVNNVLCFPYIFRGALDCGATTINDAMEVAAVHAIAELAQAEQSEVVAAAYAEGEEERVLRAVQVVVDENIARPVLIGRPAIIAQRCEKFGLRLKEGRDYDVVNTDYDERFRDYWQTYHRMTERKGVTAQLAKIEMRRRLTLIGAMMLHKGEVNGMICGTWGSTANHLLYIDQVIGKRPGVNVYAAMNGLILPGRQVFLVDTHVNADPSAAQLAEITIMAAEEMKRLGVAPKAALLSHSSFGASSQPSAQKMRDTLALLRERAPWLEVDGEMHGDAALDPAYRAKLMPNSTLTGEANLLVMPNIDAANISYNLLKTASGGGIAIGPILLGAARPVHVLTPSTTVRRIVNMTALTVADANATR